MKKREIIVASHNEKIKKIQEEKEAIAKEIISELEDINKINDELVEIEFEDFESNQDIYKYLNEINILNLEIAEIEGFNPIQEAFSIELKETYGIIRQYPLKFFLKSDHLVLLT